MGQTLKSDRHSFPTALAPADMAAKVTTFAPATEAEALKLLRASFPECPLSMRIAALDCLMRRPRGFGPPYRPR
ncbi:MAG: hypothetical protein ACRECA_04530 [Pseudolabrys sp.]